MSKAEPNAFWPLGLDETGLRGLGETTTNYGRALLMALDRQENNTQ
nr:hypothetical protein [Rhizobium leguminosarum]